MSTSTCKRIILWYRNDLRLHDHEPLHTALREQGQVIALYCFDPRQFSETSFGFPKTGDFRARFLLESVADLRSAFETRNSGLIIRQGLPEALIPALASELGAEAVYYHREVTSEELKVEQALTTELERLNIGSRSFWGNSLFHPEDLPFEICKLPEVFTNFRKQVEHSATVRPTFPVPERLSPLPEVSMGELPGFEDLGSVPPVMDERAVLQFRGGESAGFARLDHYFWKQDHLKVYKQTRNGMLGGDYSSKFSPWLAHGCLSPRHIYEQIQDYEERRVANDSTYWLVFELLWRDYFRFIAAKHGRRLFRLSGLQGVPIAWKEDWERFGLWQEGMTGFPLVDANMRELAATGFMSNRGRQNVASFLTKNLGINWQMGAEWFESLLIDYDVC
ncbi:MAG: DASH family cryptochrome, partial [Gemmatimonadaceae bacterium]|nr:DASH family cryptochrome [Gloeobacterales cyanobacterium ES-bin-141]